jgi:DNA-binding NarL/FixJ family response regulator
MRIIVVDDNDNFRSDLKFFIEHKLHHKIIAEAASGEEFLKIAPGNNVDIILTDISMKEIDGFNTVKQATNKFPYLKFIAITMYIEKVYLMKLIESGFKGCVFKNELYDKLELAIQTVSSGHMFFPDDLDIT